MIETTKCEYCYHHNVCKYRNDMQNESQKIAEILGKANLSQLEKLSVLNIKFECSNYVSAADVINKHSNPYFPTLTNMPNQDKPYIDVTWHNANVNTNAYSNKEI